MPVLTRSEQEALVDAIDSNDAIKLARLATTPELACTILDLVRSLAVLQDDARYDPPGPKMRDFLTTCNGWPPAPAASRPSKATKMAAATSILRALDGLFDHDQRRDSPSEGGSAPSAGEVRAMLSKVEQPRDDDERPRQKRRLTLTAASSSSLLVRSPSPTPPATSTPTEMHIDPKFGARLGTTLCYSADYITPTQFHQQSFVKIHNALTIGNAQRTNMVVKILKTSTSSAASATQYRVIHVDVGDGETTTLRAYRGSSLFQHKLHPGDIVELRRVGVLVVNKRDAVRCDEHSSHCRFPEEIRPRWEQVGQWHDWMDAHRR
ncbi:hypothetical protein PSEUBRA_006258 [Kalmanozyma brasiliensis GHG001]|uniref:uncharacterized protein n=1 Tax=Kalmanozyma brasiliensis (strain GHG001) TaxID=1365824 RepID=UPI002868098F|nr:uncharacterized protein PSEUBRA_006258 [Kalmanozyma brasiliensis GHG001]KAF6767651.1 hypothetical protein PSEUBRA_006258 [Kalmanozyma brasiliensis GHG001]